MEKSVKNEKIVQIMNDISKILDIEVTMLADDEQKLFPNWDVSAMLSKFLALCVYAGWNVPPTSILVAYNRVHADVEFWKKKMEELENQSKNESGA